MNTKKYDRVAINPDIFTSGKYKSDANVEWLKPSYCSWKGTCYIDGDGWSYILWDQRYHSKLYKQNESPKIFSSLRGNCWNLPDWAIIVLEEKYIPPNKEELVINKIKQMYRKSKVSLEKGWAK